MVFVLRTGALTVRSAYASEMGSAMRSKARELSRHLYFISKNLSTYFFKQLSTKSI